MKLRAVMIGAGAIAGVHVDAVAVQANRCSVVAVANRTLSVAERLIEDKKLSATAFSDYKEMVESVKPDLAIICTPPQSHAEIASYCLERGVHTVLEKPMAMTLVECDRILAARDKGGAELTVVAQLRYTGEYYRLHRLLNEYDSGPFRHVAINAHYYRGDEYYHLDWRGRWSTEGGGCTFIHAIHFMDQLLWLVGKPKKVMTLLANQAHPNSEAEDISETILQYDSGLVGHITSSLVHHGEDQGLVIQTERAGFSIPHQIEVSRARSNGFPEDDIEARTMWEARYKKINPPLLQGHAGQLDDFLNGIEGRASSYVTGEEGRAALELVQAIYKSGATGQIVTLPLTKHDPFYDFSACLDKMPHFHEKKITVERFDDTSMTISGEKSVESI